MNAKLKWTLAVFALVVALLFGAWFSGLIMLWRLDMATDDLGLTTYARYWWAHGDSAAFGRTIRNSGLVGFGVPLLIFAAGALWALINRKQNIYGDARFATLADLKKKKMLDPDDTALVVGRKNGKYIYFNGQQFALLAAPTRSGKGVGIVIPNLLSYQGSVVVLDIKQENFDLTSGFRAKYGQDVFLFNPFAEDLRTHRWNPLSYVSDDPHFRVSDVQSIAAMLYPVHEGAKDPFWSNQAQNAFVAFALYGFEQAEYLTKNFGPEAAETPTIGSLFRLASGRPGQDFREYLNELASWPHLSQSARSAFATLQGQAKETFASIMGTFKEPLNPWLNPVVDAATSGNDFDLRDVRKRKMTIYVAIQPNKLAESRLILNLFFSQLINQNVKELPQANPELKHQCLLLMDEFTSIGRVDIIASAVSFMAGYNMRLLPIIQSLSQLESTYGPEVARTLITNHALQILYAPREQRDANEYSEMLGYVGVKKDSISRNRGREKSVTKSTAEERRALMLPQELKAMGDNKEILMVEGMAHPVMADKIRYYQDKDFTVRLEPKLTVPKLKLPGGSASAPTGFPKRRSTAAPATAGGMNTGRAGLAAASSAVAASARPASAPAPTATAAPPKEYTGLAGIQEEFSDVLGKLDRR
ncbi:type IV secretory system conjugative DNA transfer family protein [Hydrogenophaga sp. 5NK40-0174]|uniref:type IV secretory system conjugative DNA transfer family protein n=1 Tax=Hydrogenophaga sp. 5NK40-0174 TaxID=3127649 RepID=UPI003102E129